MTDRNPFDTLRENPFEDETPEPGSVEEFDIIAAVFYETDEEPAEKTYTIRVLQPDTLNILETLRGLSWDELNHYAAKQVDRGFKVDWALELLQCPEDCDAGCYDAENFAAAHGADRTMQERHPIDREAARKGFTE
jgi:hypothetical protein